MGTSPVRPHTTVSLIPVTRLAKYHVPVARRKTPSSGMPSPLRSSSSGMSPAAPQIWLNWLATSHSPVAGRKTAMSARPSPLKSPGTGTSAAKPHTVVAPLRTYQVPVDGR